MQRARDEISDHYGDEGEARCEPQQVHVEVRSGHRVEVISGVERRRRWSAAEKAQITAQSCASGANVPVRWSRSPRLVLCLRNVEKDRRMKGYIVFTHVEAEGGKRPLRAFAVLGEDHHDAVDRVRQAEPEGQVDIEAVLHLRQETAARLQLVDGEVWQL